MKNERLLNEIGEIDDRFIAEAAPAAKKAAKPLWIKWAAAAACLCLAGFGIFAAARSGLPSGRIDVSLPPASSMPYSIVLTNECLSDEQWNPAHVRLVDTEQGLCLPGWQTAPNGAGTQEVAVYVAPREAQTVGTGEMTVEEAEKYAYLDPDSASEEMKEKILEARRVIIFHSRWVADGYSGCIRDVETGEIIETLPTFSALFPGWDLPVYDNLQEQVTQDGLGVDCLYGLELTVLQVNDAYLRCAVREPTNRFAADQVITVYPLEDCLTDTLGVKNGDSIFISYFGKNCSLSAGTIRANSIETRSPFEPTP